MMDNTVTGCIGLQKPIAPNECPVCTIRDICEYVIQHFIPKKTVKEVLLELEEALRK